MFVFSFTTNFLLKNNYFHLIDHLARQEHVIIVCVKMSLCTLIRPSFKHSFYLLCSFHVLEKVFFQLQLEALPFQSWNTYDLKNLYAKSPSFVQYFQ